MKLPILRILLLLQALQVCAFANRAFVERMRERTGEYPGLYSGEYHLRQVLNSPKVTTAQRAMLTKCWLWIANYHYEPRATAPWDFWHLWQYCGDGKCDLPRAAYPT